MHRIALLVTLLAVVACKKKDGEPAAASKEPAPAETGSAGSAAPPTPAPTPTPAPPPTPVKLTAEELNPTCAKIFTAELAKQTHDATEVKDGGPSGGRMALCQMMKNGEQVGSVTIACNPDLDPTAIERERAAMTKATDMTPAIGRGGYRLAGNFFLNDDETPCRLMVNWIPPLADDAWPDKLRAIVAAVNPGTLK